MNPARCMRCNQADCFGNECAPTHCRHGVDLGDHCARCERWPETAPATFTPISDPLDWREAA